MASIGKIQLGKKSNRAFFNMSHDVNTTLGYGFYEPTCCMDVIPDTKLDFKAMPGVRLAPLPQPTTGLVTVKNFYHFVPIQEVFEAFDNFQSGTEVSSSRGVYTPKLANHIGNWHLFAMLLAISKANFVKVCQAEGEYNLRDLDGVFFNFSFSSNYDLWTGEDAPVHNLFDDVIAQGAGTGAGYEPLKALRAFVDSVDNSLAVLQKYFFHLLDVQGYNKVDTSILAHRLSFTNYTNVFSSAYTGDYSTYGYQDYIDFCKNLKADDAFIFQQGRSYENADFMFELPISYDGSNAQLFRAQDIDASVSINMTGKKIYIGIHLTPAGKRLFKIFNCIGVNFGTFASVETDKLLAYYKCWFDKFNPGRTLQWKATNAYRIIHSYFDSPSFSFERAFSSWFNTNSLDASWVTCVNEFFTDLVECFYTEKVDPITVATTTPVAETDMVSGSSELVLYNGDGSPEDQSNNFGYGNNIDGLGGLSVRFLQSLYHLVNKNTVIGQRVALYMKEHFGIQMPKTTFIDEKKFDITIIDAVGTVNNDATQVGEYAGLGRGKGINGINYTCDNFGYFFQFTVIVPRGGYVQAGKLAKVNRLDWYQPAYDSLGMEPLSEYEMNSRNSILGTWKNTNVAKGFRPRYFSQKYMNNLANGGFSFRSERAQFLGYSLDKVFSEPDYLSTEETRGSGTGYHAQTTGGLKLYEGVELFCDEELRYIGKNQQYGNYNRIFYDTTGMVDNFILYIRNDVKMYAPMKPIERTFETYDETSDTDVMNVEHS